MTANAQLQRTSVCVDGLNFYYGAVKDTPYKWQAFMALFRDLLKPTNDIRKIRYFTAMVSGKTDPGMRVRQEVFLRALETIPELEVHNGKFLVSTKWLPLNDPPSHLFRPVPQVVCVQRTEKKGSERMSS